MNRLHHLKQTLPKNILDNSSRDVEFVVLDYNSTDGLETWIHDYMMEYIESGKLTYYKTNEPSCFHRSHSRNLMFKLAQGRYICNIDADNFTGQAFGNYLKSVFSKNENAIVLPDLNGVYYKHQDALGRFCCLKEDFLKVGGYDEQMSGYGYEDEDLYFRLKRLNRTERIIQDLSYLKALKHDNVERVENEFFAKNFKNLYLNYQSDTVSEILILCNNGVYYQSLITKNKKSDIPPLLLKDYTWNIGQWQQKSDQLILTNAETREEKILTDDAYGYNYEGNIFYHITRPKLLQDINYNLSLITNIGRYNSNKQGVTSINSTGFGSGSVYKNFTNKRVTIV